MKEKMKKHVPFFGSLCLVFVFAGALVLSGCSQSSGSSDVPAPKPQDPEVTLTFDADGGTFTGADSGSSVIRQVLPDDPVSLPVPEKTGFAFAGWTPSIHGVCPEEDATYTARWKTGLGVTAANVVEVIAALDGAGPHTLVLTGEISTQTITDIKNAMSDNNDAMIDFDMEASYGITYLYSYPGFKDCTNLTSIVIPETVTYLQDNVFNGCTGLVSVTLPDSVNLIANTPAGTPRGTSFSFCPNLEEIHIGEGNETYTVVDNVVYTKDMKKLVAYPAGKKDTAYTLPATVEEIGHYAIDGNTHLSSVTLPNGTLKTIGFSFIRGCTNVTSLTIPASVEECRELGLIGDDLPLETLVVQCPVVPEVGNSNTNSVLTTVTLEEGVTTIPGGAFEKCTALSTLHLPSTLTTIEMDYRTFLLCNSLQFSVSAQNNSFSVANGILYDKNKTKVVYVPPQKTSVTLPSTVTVIGAYAFRKSNISNITLPSRLTTLEDYAFNACESLSSISLPATLTSIGASVFDGCEKISSINIPDTVKTLGRNAFSYTKITTLTIPATVEYIGYRIVWQCPYINTVVFESPDNWYRTSSSYDAERKRNGELVDLSDASANADYFNNTYYWYHITE